VCLGAAWLDIDQDGDLDLVVCQYAATAADALKLLKGKKGATTGQLHLYLNDGTAPPSNGAEDRPPLDCCFRRADDIPAFQGPPLSTVGVVVSDIRDSRTPDLLVLSDQAPPGLVRNDRLLRFRRTELPEALTGAGAWNGALVIDVLHRGRSDLLLLGAGGRPQLLRRTPDAQGDTEPRFVALPLDSPPLMQALAVDVDLDGWTDVVGLSAKRRPVLLHNEAGKLVPQSDALGEADAFEDELIALTVMTSDDGLLELLAWSEGKGLQRYTSPGNGNHGLRVALEGRTALQVRSNRDGVGTWAVAQAGEIWTAQEYTTLSAGLAQSRQPLLLGLGRYPAADAVRLRWPDGTRQAERDLRCGPLHSIRLKRRIHW
jgi:hypothetical protein